MTTMTIGTGGDKRWSLVGTTALITGGTRGIGQGIVEELAGFGASIYTCSRNQKDLDQRLEEWTIKGFKVTGSVCDLQSPSQREQLMKSVASEFGGKLNILVNNAGIIVAKETTEFTAEDFSSIMSTNFEASYHLCQLAHPLLKASGTANILFISSIAGIVAFPTISIYASSKGAINQLTKNLACEWAKDNIRVNSVAPWVIRTQLIEQVEEEHPGSKERMVGMLSRTPLGRPGELNELQLVVVEAVNHATPKAVIGGSSDKASAV
ncbi:hypothetical protein AgCh_005873 [Apium graveolens]